MPWDGLQADPLLFDFALPLRRTYSHIGFPIELITNSPEVLEAAEESWGKCENASNVSPIEIRLGVLPGGSTVCPPPPECRGQHNLVIHIADHQNYTVCDTRQGVAFGWVTETAVLNRGYFRYHFLEGTAWIMLVALYLTPVHGACVQFDGAGVLLSGESGAGKSSLAYACACRGWNFLCDDASYLIRRRGGRVVTGNSRQFRFRESAVGLFPDLRSQPVRPRASGDLAIELFTDTCPDIMTISECSIDLIIFLNREGSGPLGVFPVAKRQAMRRIEQTINWGDHKLRNEHRIALQNLLGAEIFEMRYTTLHSGIEMMETLIRRQLSISSRVPSLMENRHNA